jgi:RecB family endonuclease NucS
MKVWETIGKVVAVLLCVGFILCGVGIIFIGVEADRKEQTTVEQTVEENQLIEATVVGVGAEYTPSLKLPILCQDRKGKYWKTEISGTPSKGQNVVLEIENEKVKTVWIK